MEFITEKDRIYKKDDGGKIICEVNFPSCTPEIVAITRTFVDESLRGQGIASVLLEKAVAEIRAQNKKIRPVCSYAVEWFKKHTEFSDLLE